MRNIRWFAVTIVLFTITLGFTEWSRFMNLVQQREWRTVLANEAGGELGGLRVGVREARASVIDNVPDRALLYLRIELQGPRASGQSWGDCRVSLHAPDGSTWLPMQSYSIRGAIRILASDGNDNGSCYPAEISEDSPTAFDQIYRLPISALDALTLRVSGYGTRPAAIAFPLKPEVRRFTAPSQ